jgi:hypothetical protein
VSDTVDQVTWINITQDSTTNLATVARGHTFEVINVLGTITSSSNWQQSCTNHGTPGDVPLASCSIGCVDTNCQASGDSSAYCSGSVCQCTPSEHYYSSGLSCVLLEPPSSCITYVEHDQYENQFGTVTWQFSGLKLSHYFQVTYMLSGTLETADTAAGANTTYYLYTAGTTGIYPKTDTVPTVKTIIGSDADGNEVSSVTTSCHFQTWAPTTQPTSAPTLKPTKKPTLLPSKLPTKRPTKRPTHHPTKHPTKLPTKVPTSHPTVSGYEITSCAVVVTAGTTNGITITYELTKYTTVDNTDEDLTLQLNLNRSTALTGYTTVSSSPQTLEIPDAASNTYYLWPEYRMYPDTGSYTGFSRGATCTVTTSQPTKTPTKLPTNVPTKKPTKKPTLQPTKGPTKPPTLKPTYQSIEVTQCALTLGHTASGEITTATVVFTEPTLDYPTTPESSNLEYIISWGDSENQQFSVASEGSGDVVTNTATDILIAWGDTATITAYTIDNSAAAGPSEPCTLYSYAPTRSPTPAPHAPTQAPVVPNIDLVLDSDICEAGTTDAEGNTIYVCTYSTSSGAYTIDVGLTTPATSFAVSFTWDIIFNHTKVEPDFVLGTDALATPDDLGNSLSGSGSIEADTTSGTFSILVTGKTNTTAAAEVAWLRLKTCTYVETDTCTVAMGEGQQKAFRIAIVDTSAGKQTSTNNKGKMPTWVWYPIAAGILLLAGLAAFGYMYYNKRKLAEEQLQQREADLQNAEQLDNLDNFGALGDNITFNPIATAGTQDVATGGDYIDKQLAKQQKHAEFAQVDVDKEVWRQDFGQVKADRRSEV